MINQIEQLGNISMLYPNFISQVEQFNINNRISFEFFVKDYSCDYIL